jgi:hypothetical protein
MSVSRWFSMVLIVVALPSVAARALARGDRGGHPTRADEAQVRELLAKLAAASGTPEPEERTDADLMYEAMLRWNGEPAEAKTIDRVLDQSKRDAAKAKRAMQDKVRHMFWKDPFADKLVPVRQEDRDLLDSYARKQRRETREPREAREPRDDVSRLRAELAEARAENARIRERADEMSDRRGCVADASSSDERRKRRRIDAMSDRSVRSHHAEGRRAEIALASTVPEQPYTPPAPPPVTPAGPPPAHGIIIEHLPSPPPPAPVVEARRRSQRSR